MIEALMGNVGVGIVTVLTGLLLFAAWLGAFPLCADYTEDEMTGDGEG